MCARRLVTCNTRANMTKRHFPHSAAMRWIFDIAISALVLDIGLDVVRESEHRLAWIKDDLEGEQHRHCHHEPQHR